MDKISIVVPVHDVKEYLERCLDSLTGQDYSDYEIILVDDGSSDGSEEICDRIAKNKDGIRVIHHDKCRGLSAARNTGIDASAGEYIIFVDSDDFMRNGALSKLMRIMKKYGCDIVQCGYEKGSDDKFLPSTKKYIAKLYGPNKALDGYRLKSQAWGKLYKACLFEDIRFPEGVINEDEFTTYKLVYKSSGIAITDEKLYYYYQRESSIMGRVISAKGRPEHKDDWLKAYLQRIAFFKREHEPEMVYRTYEKECTDLILRYTEMAASGAAEPEELKRYHERYTKCYRFAVRKKRITPVRRVFYGLFKYFPGFIARIVGANLRK